MKKVFGLLRRDAEKTAIAMKELADASDELRSHQKAWLWTVRVWLFIGEPLISIAVIVAALMLMFYFKFVQELPGLGFAFYMVAATVGVTSLHLWLSSLRRRIIGEVLARAKVQVAGVGGTTSAMLPALRPRDE
jgi:FlaA1/EpsC-like NDP-sugar epimerase